MAIIISLNHSNVHEDGLYTGEEVYVDASTELRSSVRDQRNEKYLKVNSYCNRTFDSDGCAQNVSEVKAADFSLESMLTYEPYNRNSYKTILERETRRDSQVDSMNERIRKTAISTSLNFSSAEKLRFSACQILKKVASRVKVPMSFKRSVSSQNITTNKSLSDDSTVALSDITSNSDLSNISYGVDVKASISVKDKSNSATRMIFSEAAMIDWNSSKKSMQVEDVMQPGDKSYELTIARTWSTMTQSTCDFNENVSWGGSFESSAVSNPWDAAKKGDYASLLYIAQNNHPHIWTSEDENGNVPLYYAFSSKETFGKYGQESLKLLLNLWPEDIPSELVERCMRDAINEDSKILLQLRSPDIHLNLTNTYEVGHSRPSKLIETQICGLSCIQSKEDDFGFVEDY